MNRQSSNIDLRSDTVTHPTPEMYRAMAVAELGDDALDGDPTVRLLEAEAAAYLGKSAALYVPTATMANLLAVLTQSRRGETVLMEATSHLCRVQQDAAILTGTIFQGLAGQAGAIDLNILESVLAKGRDGPRAALVCMESSHNHAGGTILALDHMEAVRRMASRSGCAVHLDGARLFNAAVASGVAPKFLAESATTVSVCLSKGLSAPVGALLVGPESVISSARSMRKLLGGSQRQAGITAAAGRVAIHRMVDRLAEDHDHARKLSQGLDAQSETTGLRVNQPETNIVLVDTFGTGHPPALWAARLREHGVLVRPWDHTRLRCVTHRHIGRNDIASVIDAFGLASRSLSDHGALVTTPARSL